MLTLLQCISAVLVLVLQTSNTRSTDDIQGCRLPPTFANQHPNVYVFEADINGLEQSLALPCPIDAPSSTLEYTWFRENRELPGSMVNGEGSLVIPNITEGDYASWEGVDYHCIASDNIGFDVAVRSRTITVYYAYFDGFNRTTNSNESVIEIPIPVALNSDVALKCDVLDANPPPQIKWFHDQGEIQEVMQNNMVRFLDNRRYLYLRRLQPAHLERRYYCVVTNTNLSHEVSAPTRYVLTDNLTQGVLMDYKQIGDLTAFVRNTSFEFAYVGGVFGNNSNLTTCRLRWNQTNEVGVLGNIGKIVRMSLPGNFTLKATVLVHLNKNGVQITKSGTLTMNQVPNITSSFQDERDHLVGEENLTYSCEFEGFPLPSVVFYFNGVPILANNTSGVITVNNILTIPSPQASHSGIYQCIVRNKFGDDQRAWVLEIRKPILPQVQPYNFTKLNAFDDRDIGALFTRDNGSTVRFFVDVIADPCPDVVWSFNSTRLGPSNETFTYNNACSGASTRGSNWTFTLDVVLTESTSGIYNASFTNIAGITSLPKVYFTIPKLVSVTNLTLTEPCLRNGSTVSFRCGVAGFPRPDIEFLRNGFVIITPQQKQFENFLWKYYNEIAIMNISTNAGGRYSCRIASTSISSASDAQPQLQATEVFEYCTIPQITNIESTSRHPRTGEPFSIECTATGIPKPEISWRLKGTVLNDTDIYTCDSKFNIIPNPSRNSSRLRISAASNEFNGTYECIIFNDAGSDSKSIDIYLQASLSQEAIVGISVGIVFFTIIVLILIIWLSVEHAQKDKFHKRCMKYEEDVQDLEKFLG